MEGSVSRQLSTHTEMDRSNVTWRSNISVYEDLQYRRWLKDHYIGERDALPENSIYVRWIKGEFNQLEKELSSSQNTVTGNVSERPTDGHSKLLEEFLHFRHQVEHQAQLWVTDIKICGDPNHSIQKDPYLAQHRTAMTCNQCGNSISSHNRSFHCSICDGGQFDLCEDCVDSGVWCRVPSHNLRLVKDSIISFGRPVRVFSQPSLMGREMSEAQSTPQYQPPDASLARVLDSYLQQVRGQRHSLLPSLAEPATAPKESQMVVWAVYRWARICMLLFCDEFKPSFRSVLSSTHLESIKLLQEWWLGEIHDYQLTCMGIHGALIEDLYPGSSFEDIKIIVGVNKSYYHSSLLVLFLGELSVMREAGSSRLGNDRIMAARHACAQRAGYLCLHGSLKPAWYDADKDIFLSASRFVSDMAATSAAPMVICKAKNEPDARLYFKGFIMACYFSLQLSIANLKNAEQILGPKTFRATVAPCPWLSRAEISTSKPFYLWDTKLRKTIETRKLRYAPVYTAVSHTWGRWRTQDESLNIPGVPWRLPQNSRFPVRELPEILEQVPGRNRYVWFDLVCIPQTSDDEELQRIKQQEISRQASIFGNAEITAAWFSDLEDFDALDNVVRILAISASSSLGHHESSKDALGEARRLVTQKTLRPPLIRNSYSEYNAPHKWYDVMHEWFTSLWTLQEACMRPDMWLCTRNWKYVTAPSSNQPMSLDGILSLIWANIVGGRVLDQGSDELPYFTYPSDQRLKDKEKLTEDVTARYGKVGVQRSTVEALPNSVSSFIKLMSASGMIDLPGISPIQIILLGNQRYCRSRRAEAIMAVLGVTEWFNAENDVATQSKEPVLGRYPLSFINEVREKLGDDVFFGAITVRDFWAELDDGDITAERLATSSETCGTLLPFGGAASWTASISLEPTPVYFRESKPHDALSTWLVQPNGSVRISSASILVSSLESASPWAMGNGPHDVRLLDMQNVAKAKGQSTSFYPTTNLLDWIRTRPFTCYAVCLARHKDTGAKYPIYRFVGVLLRELRFGVLIKCGVFETLWFDNLDDIFPISSEVNWVVI